MRIGWIGLGKVGLPCALAAWQAGCEVTGHDLSDRAAQILAGEVPPPMEAGFGDLLASSWRFDGTLPVRIAASLDEMVSDLEPGGIVVIAVPTPHDPSCDGTRPAPAERSDYDYTALAAAVRDLGTAARQARRPLVVAVLSTTLPGTMSRVIRPLAGPWLQLVYAPAFISLGDTIAGYRHPPFLLAGSDPGAEDARDAVLAYLRQVAPGECAPVTAITCDLTTAEMVKVAFNAHRSMQIGYANWLAELCERTGADVGPVVQAIGCSLPFPEPGMPDGGACRPRDLIALSWLARDASSDLAGALIAAREGHAEWLAKTAVRQSRLNLLPVVLMGWTYKPGTDLTDGSPARLIDYYLAGLAMHWDPLSPGEVTSADKPAVYVHCTQHPEFAAAEFPAGSVVIDPWGTIPRRPGVTVIRPGRR